MSLKNKKKHFQDFAETELFTNITQIYQNTGSISLTAKPVSSKSVLTLQLLCYQLTAA